MRDQSAGVAEPGTTPVHIISRLSVIAVAAVLLAQLAGDAFAFPEFRDLSTGVVSVADVPGTLAQSADGTWHGLSEWMRASYERAPALVLGLAALLLVPPLAFIGLLLRSKEPPPQDADVTYLKTRVEKASIETGSEGSSLTERLKAPAWPSEAWIVVDGEDADGVRHGIGRALVRIGRESDNDIRLNDKTVHRYHAAIRRTEDAEFIITDLSSVGGNGVTINGRAVAESPLADGDSIELGHAKLKFIAKPA